MTVLLNNQGGDNTVWQQALAEHLPAMPVFVYPQVPEPDSVHYAMVWGHPKGDLQRYSNLRAVFSLGAGMEHLTTDPDLPDVPLVSLGDPMMAQDMANYALYWVIDRHRRMAEYRTHQQHQCWERFETPPAYQFKVCVLGLGRIGQTIVRSIHQMGFTVSGWDFKAKALTDAALDAKAAENIAIFAGPEQLDAVLADADVVVCCLALSERSQQLIDQRFLAKMANHACLVNVSRGAVIDEQALLTALDDEQIGYAALDVFCEEPLSIDNRLWQHPKVAVTPHMAGPTHVHSAVGVIAGNIRKMEMGGLPEPVFDRNRGLKP